MAPVITDAIILHALDYLETSRIFRLVTRDAGVQSVIAKGARRHVQKYGSAAGLFAQGEAQIYIRGNRDLHTLASFDVTRANTGLAMRYPRFVAAAALAELVLRLGRDDSNPALYEVVEHIFGALAVAEGEAISTIALAGAWRIVAICGFAPSLEVCASCHQMLSQDATVLFAVSVGGAVCPRCAFRLSGRQLPPVPRLSLRQWLSGQAIEDLTPLSILEQQAHLRLFREFLREHLADDRSLPALANWEHSVAGGDKKS